MDCLVGVDYVQFRKANPEFIGLSDTEISHEINVGFRTELQPLTADWNGFELTFYVNPGATDIRSIHPYAAYNLTYDEWTVYPDPTAAAPVRNDWEQVISADKAASSQAYTRYQAALQDLQVSTNGASRRNAETRLQSALQQGSALFDEIHSNRTMAFSSTGEGYSDFHNYRWQAGKREGTIQRLRELREHAKSIQESTTASLYGAELPDTETLIRRAALYRAK